MMKNLNKILMVMAIIGIIIFGAVSKENLFNKKSELKDHDTVVDYIYDKYYSNTDIKKEAYEFKSYWKNNELMYVTEHHTEGGMHYVAIFDKDLNLVNGHGECSSNYDDLMEDVYKLIEEL
jgi:hypothetical protein